VAAPKPTAELTRLDKLISAGLPPVVLITGESEFFRRQAIDRLIKAVPEDAELRHVDGADLKSGGDDDADDAAAASATAPLAPELQDLRGGGLFATRSFVVVRRGAEWWRQNCVALADLVPKIPQGSSLLLESAKLDKRKKAAASLVKQLVAAKAFFEFRDLYDTHFNTGSLLTGELCQWVQACGKKIGVELTPEAALLLMSQVGKLPQELLAELERLKTRFGVDRTRAALAPEDLAGKLSVSFESTPFEFAEAVLAGDRAAAYRSLSAMFERGVRQKGGGVTGSGGVLPFLSSWLFQQFGRVYEGRLLVDSGVSLRDVPHRLGVRHFQDRFTAQVQNCSIEQLRRGVTALHACQRKSRLIESETELLLERFLAQWFDGAPIETAEELEL